MNKYRTIIDLEGEKSVLTINVVHKKICFVLSGKK